ncbi:hypothetical protein BKA69DRAFT_1121736 [Paraphysoderma sedebokerense]|nr:hypothetical protein BKA69DRAFT_1121736 [Paraphysoderma sedebokerense]
MSNVDIQNLCCWLFPWKRRVPLWEVTIPLWTALSLAAVRFSCSSASIFPLKHSNDIVNEDGDVVYTDSIVFDAIIAFSSAGPISFGTENGYYRYDDGSALCPPTLWLKAIDEILENMKKSQIPFNKVKGISGAAQQHGSVYLSNRFNARVSELDPSSNIFDQLAEFRSEHARPPFMSEIFSIQVSPIWLDSSTRSQCNELTAIGGEEWLWCKTGSTAWERFTASQILKLRQQHPDKYGQTERIGLISSFLSSIFVQSTCPLDASDASGMNILDIEGLIWNQDILDMVSGGRRFDLHSKLGEVVVGENVCGKIGSYFIQRFGFSSECRVISFTGDNPATMQTYPLHDSIIVSLGTSDTVFLPMDSLPTQPHLTSHLFVHPSFQSNKKCPKYMELQCFKNGSLTRRKKVKEQMQLMCEARDDPSQYESWEFMERVISPILPELQKENIFGFYFHLPELIPRSDGNVDYLIENGALVKEFTSKSLEHAVAKTLYPLIHTRLCSIIFHVTELIGDFDSSMNIIVTGRASENETILRMFANIVGQTIYHSTSSTLTASYGAAMRAIVGTGYSRPGVEKRNYKSIEPGYKFDRKKLLVEYQQAEQIVRAQMLRQQK